MNTMTLRLAQAYDKQYLSPSQTRRLSVEMPIGDPTGGPAYGKREMPVAVVALAAYSFATAAIAYAATASIVSMVIAGAVMAGSAMVIAGTITGNEKLTKVGGIISLVGGVAGAANSMANSASTFGSAAAEDAAMEASANAAKDAAANAGTQAVGDVAANQAAEQASNYAMQDSAGGMISNEPVATTSGTTQAVGTGAVDGSIGVNQSTQEILSDPTKFDTGATNTMATQDASAFKADTTFGSAPAEDVNMLGMAQDAKDAGGGIGGYFDKAGQWVKNNKELAQIGTQAIGGLFPTNKSKAEADYYKAKTEEVRLANEQERKRQLWRRGLIA